MAVVLASAILTACGAPATAWDHLEALDLECERTSDRERQRYGSDEVEVIDDAAACATVDGDTVTISTGVDDPGLMLAALQDQGQTGPWVVGDDWVVSVETRARAQQVVDVLGGDIVDDWTEVSG